MFYHFLLIQNENGTLHYEHQIYNTLLKKKKKTKKKQKNKKNKQILCTISVQKSLQSKPAGIKPVSIAFSCKDFSNFNKYGCNSWETLCDPRCQNANLLGDIR